MAGDKAFRWDKEFPEVFDQGGFDVVIGNPPYVSSKGENFEDQLKKYFNQNYSTATYQIDLYVLFLERALAIQSAKGLISFIVPNTWLNNLNLAPVRQFLLKNTKFREIVSMASSVFQGANVDTVIFSYGGHQDAEEDVNLVKCSNSEFTETGKADQSQWLKADGSVINVFLTKEIGRLLAKIDSKSIRFGEIANIVRGVGVYHKRVGHSKEFIASNPFLSDKKEDSSFVPYLRGRNLSPWRNYWDGKSFISYGDWLAEPRDQSFFEGPRILVRKILSKGLIATYIEDQFVVDQQIYTALTKPTMNISHMAVLGLLCSKLVSFYFRYKFSEFDELFPQIKLAQVKDLPIFNELEKSPKAFEPSSKRRFDISCELVQLENSLVSLLESKYGMENFSRNLQNWPSLDFKGFLKELKKAKVNLSLKEEAEWMDYFNAQKAKVQALQEEVDALDKQIDEMVYGLYGLSEEEIGIVEGV